MNKDQVISKGTKICIPVPLRSVSVKKLEYDESYFPADIE